MHRNHFLTLLMCLFFLNIFISVTAINYNFANHPTAEEDIYTGFIADLDTSNSLAVKFETTLSESLAEGANFAGKYRLTTVDCGNECEVNVIIDVSSGKVVDSMVSGSGVEFTTDSRLVHINPNSEVEYYLVWNEDKQRFFRAYATEVTLNDGRSCYWLGTDTNGTSIHLNGSNNIYGCDSLNNIPLDKQASILKGTLYHDGGKPLGNFNADYMELVFQGSTADIAQEKQVNIDIKQIKTQTGSCLKLEPIELEPTITIYYLCDEGDDTHIVVLSNGFSQIGNALITEMIRLERDGEDLRVSERLPIYIGLSAAAVDGVSENEKVSEVKPGEGSTEVVATESSDEVTEETSIPTEAVIISPQPTETSSTNETVVSDTTTENSDTGTIEEVAEATTQNEVQEIVEEIEAAMVSSIASSSTENRTEVSSNTNETSEAATTDVQTETSEAALAQPDESTNPQTIDVANNTALAPIIVLSDTTQETIDNLNAITNPTNIGIMTEEISTETVTNEVVSAEASETLATSASNQEAVTDSSSDTIASTTPVEETSIRTTEIEITEDNWQSHPDVVSTRMLYSEVNEFIEVNLLRQRSQSFERCNTYQESERKLWSDKGTIRRYLASYNGEQNSAQVEHTYDDTGMLRFVHIAEGVVDSESTTGAGTVLEHKIYYTQNGNLLWHDKRFPNQERADSEDSQVLETITFNPELAFDAAHECD